MNFTRAARMILVGAPGAGKGTQTTRLMNRFPQLAALSSGDLLRENVRNKTPLGTIADSVMKAGNLVSDKLVLRLILSEFTKRGWLASPSPETYTLSMAASDAGSELGRSSLSDAIDAEGSRASSSKYRLNEDPSSSFILDGFPRTKPQAEKLASMVDINFVVHLDTPASVILDRIANRWVHEPSGRIYNTTFNPPEIWGKDDLTGEPLTRRPDDDPETYMKRLQQFRETSEPLLEFYQKQGVLWTVKGNTSDEITPKLYDEVERRFVASSYQ